MACGGGMGGNASAAGRIGRYGRMGRQSMPYHGCGGEVKTTQPSGLESVCPPQQAALSPCRNQGSRGPRPHRRAGNATRHIVQSVEPSFPQKTNRLRRGGRFCQGATGLGPAWPGSKEFRRYALMAFLNPGAARRITASSTQKAKRKWPGRPKPEPGTPRMSSCISLLQKATSSPPGALGKK